jgi:DNA-directed RNA polymerase specialized sigma24 family protein
MAADDEFDRFYLGARGRLVGQLFALTGDLHDAEDLVQEAFARAAANWKRIRAYEVPEAWVRRVAFNLAHNRGRRLKRHAAALVRLGRPPEVPPMSVDLVACRRPSARRSCCTTWPASPSTRSPPSSARPSARSRAGCHAGGPPWP